MSIEQWTAGLALAGGDVGPAIKVLRGDAPLSEEFRSAIAKYLEHPPRRRSSSNDHPLVAFTKPMVLRAYVRERARELGSRDKAIAELAAERNISPEALMDRLYRPNRKRAVRKASKKALP